MSVESLAARLGRNRGRLVVAVAAFLAHASALSNGFIWLDHAHIEQGLALAQKGDGLAVLMRGFARTGFYRPLMSVVLSIDAALGGAPWVYHLSTLLFHGISAVLTCVAAEALGLSLGAALFSGLLFAVHPLNSLVANAVAFGSESLLCAALLGLVVGHTQQKPRLAAASLLIAALCKETGLVLGPLFAIALELGQRRKQIRDGVWRRLIVAEVGALAVVAMLRLNFAPGFRASFHSLSVSDALGTRLASLSKSVASMLLLKPFDRSICDAFPTTSLLSLGAVTGLIFLVGIAVLAFRLRGPASLFALALLPTLQIVPIMRWWSPHYVYVALCFAGMVAAHFIVTKATVFWQRAALVGLGVLGLISFRDAARFRNDETLWSAEVSQHPECREGQFYLGEVLRERKDFQHAAERYENAIKPLPRTLAYVDYKAAWSNLGGARLELQKFADAKRAFHEALAVCAATDPDYRKLVHNLATAALFSGDAEVAARALEAEVQRQDAFPESLWVRSKALMLLGRKEEARELTLRLAKLRTQ